MKKLQLREGAYYRNGRGEKVGPLCARITTGSPWDTYNWQWRNGDRIYKDDGENYSNDSERLIAEWVDAPVNPAPVTLSIVGTVGEVVEAFFALPQYHQAQMLRALLARVAARPIN